MSRQHASVGVKSLFNSNTVRVLYCQLYIRWLLISLVLGCFQIGYAQTTGSLSGYVIDAATNRPMPFANVYLNNSTYGTISDEKGHFVLINVPLGTVEVVSSYVGYQTTRQTIRLNETSNSTLTFRLKPAAQTLAGITVKAKRNEKKWQQQLRQFKQQLFGEPFGSQCLLTNPDVLRFSEQNGHLNATASEPLVIENQALGYRIWYDLAYFDGEAKQVHYGGSVRFEELKTTSERQANRFRRNQMRAYLGSARHLMASLIAANYEQEGFRVYQEDTTVAMPFPGDTVTLQRAIGHRLLPLNLATLIQPGLLPVERLVGSTKPLIIFYTKAKSLYSPYTDARFAYTQLTFPNGPSQVLTDGWISVPNGVEMKGSLADDRLSTLLPIDWKPAQSTDAVSLTNAITALSLSERLSSYSAEKAYIHTDRSQYLAGDTLWFSAYLLDATRHTPSLLSQTLYVNLLNSTGQLASSQILHVDSSGHAPGNIILPDSLIAGTYQLLTYTNWMRNTDPAFLFRQRIRIDSKTSRVVKSTATQQAGLRLEVFPEGGQLVVGLPGRVAFKATDNQGHSLTITGVLINQQGDTLTDFRSLHQGMGTFSVTPQAGQRYRAAATSPDGQLTSVELPEALPAGYQLAVDNVTSPNQIRIQIRNSQPQLGQLILFAHVRGQVCYQAQVDANKPDMLLAIPYDSIRQDGVLHLTLFDPDNQPVAERLVFINQNRQLRIHMQVDKSSYQPRQPVTLTLLTTNPLGKPVPAYVSLGVMDHSQALDLEPKAATLRSYLLLTSDLRGYIEEPEFYFDSTQAHVKQYVDFLMMTHGWRRFNWRAILSDSTPRPAYEAETSLSLRGQIDYGENTAQASLYPTGTNGVYFTRRANNSKPVDNAVLSAIIRTNRSLVPMDITTNKEGQFDLKNLLFSDTATIVIRQKTNLPIKLYWLPRSIPDFVALPTLSVDNAADRQHLINLALERQALAKQLRENGGRLLQAVNVKAKRFDASRTDSRRYMYGTADATVVATDQMRSLPNVLQMIQGQVAGVDVQMNTDGSGSLVIRNSHATAMIDGVIVDDHALQTISPSDVEAFDVLKNPATYAIFGVRASGGVVNILTRRGAGEGKKINQVVSKIIGYAVSREFYSPQYTSQPTPKTPDYRATLYWNPSIQTDAAGKATITFYNSDNITTIQAVAQGITPAGQPGYGALLYQVQK